MRHLTLDELWAYVDHESTQPQAVEQHLATCAACTERLRTIELTNSVIVESFQLPEEVNRAIEVPSAQSLASRVAGDESAARLNIRGHRFGRSRWVAWAGAAGTAAVVVIAGLAQFHSSPSRLEITHQAAAPTATSAGVSGASNAGTKGSSFTAGTTSGTTTSGANSGTKTGATNSGITTGGSNGGATSGAKGGGTTSGSMNGGATSGTKSSGATSGAKSGGTTSGVMSGGTTSGAMSGGTTTSGAMQSATTANYAANVPMVSATVHISVQNGASNGVSTGNASPVAGAHVAVISGDSVIESGTTNASGNTPAWTVNVPASPVFAPSFTSPQGQGVQFGVVTVVVWAAGYQPDVIYNESVTNGALSALVDLMPADSASAPVHVEQGEPHLLAIDNYVQWAEQAVARQNRPTASQTPPSTASIIVRAVDQSGEPVIGATAVIVTGSTLDGSGQTSTTGETQPIPGVGLPFSVAVGGLGPVHPTDSRTVTIVVYKAGYAPAIGFLQPLANGQTRVVTAKLDSLAWKQAQGMNNQDAPAIMGGAVTLNASAAATLLHWVQNQVGAP